MIEETYTEEMISLAKRLFKAYHGYFKSKNPQHEHKPWAEMNEEQKAAWLSVADSAQEWCLDYE